MIDGGGDDRPIMNADHFIALQAQALPDSPGTDDVPEWIHLTPVGRIETFDGRGPYLIEDPQAVIEASFAPRGDLEIDINHASFVAAPRGEEAPAQGWIKEMAVRPDGIWGRVEWTPEGRRRVAGREYRRISPVFLPDRPGGARVVAIANASLVNRQNLRGIAALNFQEDGMKPLNERLAELFGLGTTASEDDVFAAASAASAGAGGADAELQSQMASIGVILDVADGGDIVAAVRKASTNAVGGEQFVALQAELTTVTAERDELRQAGLRSAAEAFVDGAIAENRVGVSPMRERFVAMHMADPEDTETMISGFPKLGQTATTDVPPAARGGDVALNAEQLGVARVLGLSPDDYMKQLAAERAEQGAS